MSYTGTLLTVGATPADVATLAFPYSGRFTLDNCYAYILGGTGDLGTFNTTHQIYSQPNAGGIQVGSVLAVASINPPNGIRAITFTVSGQFVGTGVTIRQTVAAINTGVLGVRFNAIPLAVNPS